MAKKKQRTQKQQEQEPYFVEVDDNGCPKCGAGRTYTVVIGTDGDSVTCGQSFDDVADAEYLADRLNEAYVMGRDAGMDKLAAQAGLI